MEWRRVIARVVMALIFLGGCVIQAGCTTWDINSARRLAQVASWGHEAPVSVRARPRNPLDTTLNLIGHGGPKPSDRTEQILRRYALLDQYESNPDEAVNRLTDFVRRDPSLEMAYAWTELAYIRGRAAQKSGEQDTAMSWYCGAASQSFTYLFDHRTANYRNAYDPVFRRICDLYNQSLEGMLRILQEQDMLKPGQVVDVATANNQMTFKIQLEGRWRSENVEGFKFVSDLSVHGLKNQYRTFGLGVPLIATRANPEPDQAARIGAEFFPPDLTFPITAFFEVAPKDDVGSDQAAWSADDPIEDSSYVLHLYDPLETNTVTVNGNLVPLESDITTPLAYYLKDPLVNTNVFATLALIDGDFAKKFRGLYMLEPYDSNKIPVLMVHGLWSSPTTWTEMFNDLRADPEIRKHYQFWFYLYPSGQPFWVSADQLRQDLAEAKQKLDPNNQSRALSEMVLVGHSMGGLLARLQTYESGNDFWRIVSDQSFDQVSGDEESLENLETMLFFSANPSVRRVITLGTPHGGSDFANSATRWFSRQIFRLPKKLIQRTSGLAKANPDVFRDPTLLTITTSIDSLSPDSPFFEIMANAQRAPWVDYHNIVGQREYTGISGFLSRQLTGDGDGVVSIASARSPDTASEISVPAEHSMIQQHPNSILEVRRILREQLKEHRHETPDYDLLRRASYQEHIPLVPRR